MRIVICAAAGLSAIALGPLTAAAAGLWNEERAYCSTVGDTGDMSFGKMASPSDTSATWMWRCWSRKLLVCKVGSTNHLDCSRAWFAKVTTPGMIDECANSEAPELSGASGVYGSA
jgi:hypothetical protein